MTEFRECPNDPDHEMIRNDANDGYMCPFCGSMVYDVEEELSKAEQFSERNGLNAEINEAYLNNVDTDDPDEVSEAYQGQYESDADFVQQLLEDIGDLPTLPGYIHIDWDRTASDVMMDYFESNGFYFRNL